MEENTISITQSNAVIKTYKKNFKHCIGTGRMSLALRQDYLDNLKIIQNEIGFDYIRGHGLFNDDMGVYREAIQVGATPVNILEKPIYNFKNILKVFDNFLSVGIRPFVEFGFMPKAMAAGDKTVFWWQGNVTEPKDIGLWNEMIRRFFTTIINYYGLEEAKKWYYEVWNEPCVDFWQPTSGKSEEEYHKLYTETAKIVKEVCPEFRVGGPATQEQGVDWIPRFMAYCKENDVPLDYISHHIYTGLAREFVGEFAYMNHLTPTETVGKYERVYEMAQNAPSGPLPLHITEWNTSYSCIDLIHDGAKNGAFVAYLLTHVDSMLESYAYWVFCDVFEEADVPRALFHGGFGLLTENGIRKPSFHAFAFANKLKEWIIHMDENACVTKDDNGDIAILLFNPCVEDDGCETIDLEFELPCTEAEVFVSVQKVDDQNGNAFEVWKKLGRPRWPGGDVLETIRRAQYPSFEAYRMKSDNECIIISARLPVNGLQLIEIKKTIDETSSYQGLR